MATSSGGVECREDNKCNRRRRAAAVNTQLPNSAAWRVVVLCVELDSLQSAGRMSLGGDGHQGVYECSCFGDSNDADAVIQFSSGRWQAAECDKRCSGCCSCGT